MIVCRRAIGRVILAAGCASLVQCSSTSKTPAGDGDDACYPDNDGMTGGAYTFQLTVDDTGFSKMILNSQNDAQVTVTLTNMGTTPHGFEVECTSVTVAYPNLPAGCSTMACFPTGSTIAPLAPGATGSVTFDTPIPDNLIFAFKSSEPSDSAVPGLNDGQWTLM